LPEVGEPAFDDHVQAPPAANESRAGGEDGSLEAIQTDTNAGRRLHRRARNVEELIGEQIKLEHGLVARKRVDLVGGSTAR
jgi:hypothetical protein